MKETEKSGAIISGLAVSPGIAIGAVFLYQKKVFPGGSFAVLQDTFNVPAEIERFRSSLEEAVERTNRIIVSFPRDDPNAGIFTGQREILLDDEISQSIERLISERGVRAETAVREAFEEFIVLTQNAGDPLIAERAADFRDARDRLTAALTGENPAELLSLSGPVIIAAEELTPSDTVTMDREKVIGIITEQGGASSHAAILANSYRIPAITGVSGCMNIFQSGMIVGMDALSGSIYLDPQGGERAELESKQAAYLQKISAIDRFLDKPALTADGTLLEMGINIDQDFVLNSFTAGNCPFDFIGLFRTEFLYMQSNHIPSEQEQFQVYKQAVEKARGKTVTVRTLDIGGDKSLPYYALPREDNPFLGNRALRLCLSHPSLFVPQLKAMLRASVFGNLQIMFPMVGSIDDMRQAKSLLEKAKNDLLEAGIAFNRGIKTGIMIEIPSIAEIADIAAAEADFASIGSNDLCQYLCAADRMNTAVSGYYQSFSPAFVRVLGRIITAFKEKGKQISVCGELAGTPRGAVLLAGLGCTRLSMSASRLGEIKEVLARTPIEAARSVVETAKTKSTEREIITMLDALLYA
jgi:phosphotransferase system enzyme I (PtsI)